MPIPHIAQQVRSPKDWRAHTDDSRKKDPRRKERFRRWMWRALIALVVLFTVGVVSVVAAFAFFSRGLPDPNKIHDRVVAQSTKIYDRTGTHLLYDIHGDQKRTVVNLTDVAAHLKNATVSAEDRNFYHHKGFDLRGILRAIVTNVIHLDPLGQGGSTITQQFIKKAVLTSEKSYVRKIKELVLAYQLEKRFTKDEILKMYLNEIPYGSNTYGIEAAAQGYFGVSAKNLDLAQSALLASLPRAPTYYSPYGDHTKDLFARQHFILDIMVQEGYVTKEEAVAAKQEKLVILPHRENIVAPHFVMYVRELLTEKYGEDVVERGGLKVTTTLDLTHQTAAEQAIAEYAPSNETRYGAKNAAMVSIDTKTGQILAMVGSRDYFDIANDGNVNVVLRPRQPGSSFKPFVYATAFERGYTPNTILFDLQTNFETGGGTPYNPHNYDGKEHGPVSMRQALAGSLNIPAVKTLYLAGVNNVLDNADKFGYTTLNNRSRYGLSLVLGGADVTLLDHTSAYATLAREGVRHPATPILRVEDENKKVLEQYEKKETRVMEASAVQNVNDILTDNGARAYIFGANNHLTLPDRPVAAKTGTTNDYHDAWTLGFTPSIAAGFWVGKNDNTAMNRGADGSVVAAPMWQAYMKKVLAGTPVETFHKPPPNNVTKPVLKGQVDVVEKIPVDRITGKVIPESCRATYPKQYITTKDYKVTHDILFWVQKDEPRGPAPSDPTKDPQFAVWEKPVAEWAKQHKYPDITNLPKERCDLRDQSSIPSVSITSPTAGAILTSPTTTFSATVTATETIKTVAFIVDGNTVQTTTTPPYQAVFTNTQFENGAHSLRVVATDAIGGTGEGSVAFSYALDASAASLTISAPQNNAVFTTNDFPLTVQVVAFDPTGFSSIDLLLSDTALGTLTSPKSGPLSFSVTTLPPGQQNLTVRAHGTGGHTQSATLSLTIQ